VLYEVVFALSIIKTALLFGRGVVLLLSYER